MVEMGKYFRFRNWRKFQHYKDRNPPWIKFYVNMVGDPASDYASISDSARGQLMGLFALASRMDNIVPYDAAFIAEEILATDPVDLQVFSQWIVTHDSRRAALAAASKDASDDASESARLRDRDRVRGKKAEKNTSSEVDLDSEEIATRRTSKPRDPTPTSDPDKKQEDPPAEAFEAAQLLASLMVRNDPKAKIPKSFAEWAKYLDRLNRIDGRSWEEIHQVIRWCQRDSFWLPVILSGANLRKKFPTLLGQMKRPKDSKRREVNEARPEMVSQEEDPDIKDIIIADFEATRQKKAAKKLSAGGE